MENILKIAKTTQGPSNDEIKQIWKDADAVCIDVDSTLIQELAIHELARFCGKDEEVVNLARQEYSQCVSFKNALEGCLSIIQPTCQQITDFLKSNSLNLSPRVKELIQVLHSKNVPVYLITGSFMCLISDIVQRLNIPEENVFANRLLFYHSGNYAGFKLDELTLESNGKALIIEELKTKNEYKNFIMIGDGYTDLQACPPADAFIGYGGNSIRDSVKDSAQWYIYDFAELIAVLLDK